MIAVNPLLIEIIRRSENTKSFIKYTNFYPELAYEAPKGLRGYKDVTP
jgi:hypothetical protein